MALILFLIGHFSVSGGGLYLFEIPIKESIDIPGISSVIFYITHYFCTYIQLYHWKEFARIIFKETTGNFYISFGYIFLLYVSFINVVFILASDKESVSQYREILGNKTLFFLILSLLCGYGLSSRSHRSHERSHSRLLQANGN